jgi:hypothetical protein
VRTYLNQHDGGFSVAYNEADTKMFLQFLPVVSSVKGRGSVFFDRHGNRVDALPYEYSSKCWLAFYHACRAYGLDHVAKLRQRRARRAAAESPWTVRGSVWPVEPGNL